MNSGANWFLMGMGIGISFVAVAIWAPIFKNFYRWANKRIRACVLWYFRDEINNFVSRVRNKDGV